ncbi:MAG: cell division protein SepF [Ruminococcus sp.]|nr:cell division protein SepF [Ruminococcus sp.]
MGIVQGFKNIFLGEEEIEQEEDYRSVYDDNRSKPAASSQPQSVRPESTAAAASSNPQPTYSRAQRSAPAAAADDGSLKIVLARPEKFSEVTEIGTDINAKKTVLLNLENVKSDDAKRILDFISGVAYANDAKIKMMAQKTFAIIPSNVQFVGDDLMSELENNGYSF